MPTFAIICRDRPDAGALRAETRPRHLAYLRTLGERLEVVGPLMDEAGQSNGSLIIGRFDDLAAARAFAEADPYALAGLFDSVTVSAWRRVGP